MRMIRMAGTAAGAIAAGVLIHRVAYWDGWHKGVAHGRELGMAEARRQLAPHKVTLSADAVPVTVGYAATTGPPSYDMAKSIFPARGDNPWLDPWPGGES